jgi:AraC-like DNA-binding protein
MLGNPCVYDQQRPIEDQYAFVPERCLGVYLIEDIPSENLDPLSTALTMMKLRAYIHVALDAGGSYAIDFQAYEGFTLNVVQKGECWLVVEASSAPIRLRAGDCFLLTGGKKFTLATNPGLKKRYRAEQLFTDAHSGHAACNGGGDFFVNGTIFRFDGHLPAVLFGRLPPVIHIDGGSDQASVLRWSLDRFSCERRGGSMGRSLMLTHLAPIMLLQVLRLYLSSSPKDDNWLVALSNPSLSKVIDSLQTEYHRAWSLEECARLARMSRSGFALAFRRKVGIAPMEYLMNWRMQIACELLRGGDQALSTIASAVGYDSESAFSVAFRRVVHCRPGAYRRTQLPT